MSNNQENCQIIKTIVNFPRQLDTVRKKANSSTVDATALASLAANASGELLTTPMDVPDPEPDEMRVSIITKHQESDTSLTRTNGILHSWTTSIFNVRNTDIMLLENYSTHLARAKKFPASVGKKEIKKINQIVTVEPFMSN